MIKSKNYSETGNWELKRSSQRIHGHEAPFVMTLPLIALSFLAVFSGFMLFLGDGFGSKVYYGESHHVEGIIQWGVIDHILTSSLTFLSIFYNFLMIF